MLAATQEIKVLVKKVEVSVVALLLGGLATGFVLGRALPHGRRK